MNPFVELLRGVTEFEDLCEGLSHGATPIATAVGTAVAEAPAATLKVTVAGTPNADMAAAATATLKIVAG